MSTTERVEIVISERGAKQAARDINAVGNASRTASRSVGLLNAALAGLFTGAALRGLAQVSDNITSLENQMKTLPRQMRLTTRETSRLANAARTSSREFARTFASYARATQDFGGTAEEAAAAVLTLNRGFLVSGATTQEATASTRQFIQALQSGVLRGEEFNSVMEQAPIIAQLIAQEMDVAVTSLRALAQDGQITADILRNALINGFDRLEEQTQGLEYTFQQLGTVAKNNFQEMLAGSDAFRTGVNFLKQTIFGFIGTVGNMTTAARNLAIVLGPAALGAAISGLIGGFRILATVIRAHPLIFLGTAIAATVAHFWDMETALKGVHGEARTVGDVVTQVFNGMISLAAQVVAAVNEIVWAFGNAISAAKDFIATAAEVTGLGDLFGGSAAEGGNFRTGMSFGGEDGTFKESVTDAAGNVVNLANKVYELNTAVDDLPSIAEKLLGPGADPTANVNASDYSGAGGGGAGGGGGGGALVSSLDQIAQQINSMAQPFNTLESSLSQLEQLYQQGRISGEQYSQMMARLGQEARALGVSLQDLKKKGVDATSELSQGMQGLLTNAVDGLIDGLFELATKGKFNFQQFALGLLKQMTKLIVRALILKPLLGALGFGNGGGFGGGGGGLLGFANGGAFANGGTFTNSVVSQPTPFTFNRGASLGVMGEAGPEAILPLSRGRNGKLGVQASGAGGGGNTYVYSPTINVQGGGGSEEQNANLADQINAQLEQGLSDFIDERIALAGEPGGIANPRGGM